MKVFVAAITHRPDPGVGIHPKDYPHGFFETEKDESLMGFLKRVGMPTEGAYRLTLPEWGITATDLAGVMEEYGVRDGDTIFLLYDWAKPK